MKKLTFLAIMLLIATPCFAANKYAVGTGDWNSATLWKTSSGGSTATTQPTTSDVAILDANSGTVTINATTCVAQQLNASAFTGTLESSDAGNILTITTNINIGASTTFGSTAFRLKAGSGTATITLSVAFPWDFEWSATGTKTLGANAVISGVTYMSASPTMNSYTWTTTGLQSTTTSQRIFYGSTEVILKGGTWSYVYKRTGGKISIDGNVTITGGTSGSSSTGIYDSTLGFISGTPTVTGIFWVAGTSTIDIADSFQFDDMEFSGTTTLTSNIRAAGSIQVVGTTSVTFVASGGSYTVSVGENLIMYNLGTYINADGTVKIVMNGTGTMFEDTSLNGMGFAYAGTTGLAIDVDINTSGTITLNSSAPNMFGGGRTLTRVAGTVTASGTMSVAPGSTYYFNTNKNFTVPTFIVPASSTAVTTSAISITTLSIESGGAFDAYDESVIGTLRISGSGAFYAANDKDVNVTSKIYMNGTDSAQPQLYANPINLTEFVAGRGTQMSNTGTAGSNYRRATTTAFNDVTDFTFAFDYVHRGYLGWTIIGGDDGYLWTPSSGTGSLYFFMTPSDGYYAYVGISTAKKRIVITKAAGSAMKFYVDGVSKSVSVYGSSANLTNADINFYNFSSQIEGDFLFFNGTAKDATWVASDYAAFQANGNSTAGLYDDTETDLTAGWHVDSWTHAVTNMNLVYNGTSANQEIFRGDFRYVTATGIPIKSYFGSATECDNVYAPDWDNIKSIAYASAG